MSEHDQIHAAVRQRYGSLAEGCCGTQAKSGGCCDSGAVEVSFGNQLYEAELLEGLPVDVTGLSLGCGDPVSIADLRPGETVLDLGSGGGIDCFLAARQVGETGRVIGVDMTPSMLAKARASQQKLGVTNVEFRHGQIEALPVDSDSIDVVMSNCVINLSPDKRAVYAEIARVLKPGGRISISDVVVDGEFSDALRADMNRWSECVTGAISVEENTRLLSEVGLVDIAIVDKVSADEIIQPVQGMPRVFSARITARKPEA